MNETVGLNSDLLPRSFPGEAPALLARNVSKVFGTSRVLDGVDFAVMPAEVHGLLGANGSGKSTLIKTIAGLHRPEPGAELILYGRGVQFPLPAGGARKNGISFVHQHLALIPSLSVLENMLLNDLANEQSWAINWRAARAQICEVFDRFDIAISPDTRVADLAQSDRALVAITRAFHELELHAPEARGILILDEPTPFLPKAGVEQLFSLIRAVKANGIAVVLVAHDIDEIKEITDRATILRDGKLIKTVESAKISHAGFMELIMGRKVSLFSAGRTFDDTKPVAAKVQGLSINTVENLDFEIREGEILGLTGLIGSGFDRVPEAIYGADRARQGRLEIAGKSLDLTTIKPRQAMDHSIAFLPADRLGRAGSGSLSLADNISLPVLDQFKSIFGIDWAAIEQHCLTLGQRYDIRPNRPEMKLSSLSGGNAQKVLMAKWLQKKPRLLMLDEPTQGVDVGARQRLFAALDEASQAGSAILVASTDPEQLAQLCHRVLIFSKGRIVAQLQGDEITKERISAQTLAVHPNFQSSTHPYLMTEAAE